MVSTMRAFHPGPSVDTQTIRDHGAFSALRSDWNSLLERSAVDSPWRTHQWLDHWWDAFGGDARLLVPTVWSKGRLVAAAPMMVVEETIKRLDVQVLRFVANAVTPRSGFLVDPDADRGTTVLWSLVKALSKEWDLAILANVPRDVWLDQWRTALTDTGMRFVETLDRRSPFIDLSQGFQAFRRTISPKLRENINASRNRLSRLGVVDVQSVLGTGDVPGALETCFDISARSWKAGAGSDLGGRPAYRAFYRALAEDEVLRRRLYIWILTVDGQPIAFNMVMRGDRGVIGLATDYDLAFKMCSPGVYLFSTLLQDLCTLGVDQCDMAGDLYDYKLYWTKQYLPHSQFWIYHGGPKSRLLYFLKDRTLPTLRRRQASAVPGANVRDSPPGPADSSA
ncbi:MAG: GNAT family N-acetyltransferase [Actinobacteria bacterium]|nr:GNAT family N-acetyltransferase [Actinomycetota bacterium]